jgi:hypothetical protein
MIREISPGLQDRLSQLDILYAVDPDSNARWRPAPRLLDLNGKVGGFLGNRKHNADELLREIREMLEKRYELGDTVTVDKFVYSRPAAGEIVDSLAGRCDFVVTAIAD